MNNIVFFDYSDNRFNIVSAIRTEVFINEQGANADEEFDVFDKDSLFALLYENENAVATARIAIINGKYKIGRIAVLRAYRGRGYGADIVRAVVQEVFTTEANEVYVDSQNYAVPFYERLGFSVIGQQLIDRGLPHIPMSATKGEYYGKEK